jgi:hypothetical protein
MKQQEYIIISDIEDLRPKNLQVILNAKGKEGWKYVGYYGSWFILTRETKNEVIEDTTDGRHNGQTDL